MKSRHFGYIIFALFLFSLTHYPSAQDGILTVKEIWVGSNIHISETGIMMGGDEGHIAISAKKNYIAISSPENPDLTLTLSDGLIAIGTSEKMTASMSDEFILGRKIIFVDSDGDIVNEIP